MNNNFQIQEIMLRYLNGESSAEEANTLQVWIKESEENRKEFELIKQLWEDSVSSAKVSVNTEDAWQKIAALTVDKPIAPVVRFPRKKVFAIAASVIIMAGLFYLFLKPVAENWKETYAEKGNIEIQLADGSKITLRRGAKISLPDNYNKGTRQVKLDGEAFFEVKHNNEAPFTILTSRSIIQDIGTTFLVQHNDSTDRVSVLEGEVSLAAKADKSKIIRLLAGESAIMKKELPQKIKADTTNLLSWHSHILIFKNATLQQVAEDFKDYYQVDFEMPDSLGHSTITAEFNNDTLEQAITELGLITGLKINVKGKSVMISK
ncbi:MAG: FecR domain-containing protein [Bacteroidetes bacterium]|nr:FecR domain-containing protein [Bacteroidota bacterium]